MDGSQTNKPIRGWSVTLVVAFAFGANTLKLPPYWILAAYLPVIAFLLMEWRRNAMEILSRRAPASAFTGTA
jgi:hypothetical protein